MVFFSLNLENLLYISLTIMNLLGNRLWKLYKYSHTYMHIYVFVQTFIYFKWVTNTVYDYALVHMWLLTCTYNKKQKELFNIKKLGRWRTKTSHILMHLFSGEMYVKDYLESRGQVHGISLLINVVSGNGTHFSNLAKQVFLPTEPSSDHHSVYISH